MLYIPDNFRCHFLVFKMGYTKIKAKIKSKTVAFMTTFSINENKNAKRTANPIRKIVVSNDATIVFKFSIVVMILIVGDFTRYKYHAMKPIPSNFLKEHFL